MPYWWKIREYSDTEMWTLVVFTLLACCQVIHMSAKVFALDWRNWSTLPPRHALQNTEQSWWELTARLTISTVFFKYLFDDGMQYFCVWLDILNLRETYFGKNACVWIPLFFDGMRGCRSDRNLGTICAPIGKDLLTAYLDQLIPAIQQAIIDDDDSVRNQASTAPWLKMATLSYTNLQTLKLKILDIEFLLELYTVLCTRIGHQMQLKLHPESSHGNQRLFVWRLCFF